MFFFFAAREFFVSTWDFRRFFWLGKWALFSDGDCSCPEPSDVSFPLSSLIIIVWSVGPLITGMLWRRWWCRMVLAFLEPELRYSNLCNWNSKPLDHERHAGASPFLSLISSDRFVMAISRRIHLWCSRSGCTTRNRKEALLELINFQSEVWMVGFLRKERAFTRKRVDWLWMWWLWLWQCFRFGVGCCNFGSWYLG